MTSRATYQFLPPANGAYLSVIGTQSTGFSAAITAAEEGAKVPMVGHGTIGGICVNGGCCVIEDRDPGREMFYQARHASGFSGISPGVMTCSRRLDFSVDGPIRL